MAHRNPLTRLSSLLSLSLLLVLTGCGDFESAFDPSDDAWRTSDQFFAAQVVGSVGDGPIVNARLRVFSNSGRQLLETYSSDTADFDLRVRAQGTEYPLTIVADQGIDLVTNAAPDFNLVSVIMSPGSNQTANLTPFSTLIVKAAHHAGGINEQTIAQATEAVVTRYGFGLDTDLVPDVLFSPMTHRNVHVMVKASETLGEMIRRTRDALVTSGTFVDGDAIVAALGADLADGSIDGQGAQGHDPRIAAVANVASAAVMVEAMANRLHVYGVDATDAMDNAIRQVRPSASASSNTRNVPITAEALDQTLRSLRAAKVVNSGPHVAAIYDAVAEAEAGKIKLDALSSLIQPMSSGFHNPLNDVTLAVAYISDDLDLAKLNEAARPRRPSDSDTREDDGSKDRDGTSAGPITDGEAKDSDNPKTAPNPDGTDDGLRADDRTTPNPVIREDEKEHDRAESGPIPVAPEDQAPVDDIPVELWGNDGWLLFDGGTDSLLNTGLSLTKLASTSFTVEAIVQYTGTVSRTWTPIFGAASDVNRFFVGKGNGTNELRVWMSGLGSFDAAGDNLFDGQERHLALVFDEPANEFRVFVDHALKSTETGVSGSFAATNDLLIGGVGHDANQRWEGWIGPHRVTNRVLKPEQFLGSEGEPVAPRPNRAATISGAPQTALVVNKPWSFTPTAADPDGDQLTFSIQGKPEWADFNTRTGEIWGTPATKGSHPGIVISVSDGRVETSLSAFTLQVDEPTLGTATVSWEPPTTRTDGSALTDLAGYRVYYGQNRASLTHMVEITNVGQTSQHIENLDVGTWYFAVTAICGQGLESPKSEIGSKTIL